MSQPGETRHPESGIVLAQPAQGEAGVALPTAVGEAGAAAKFVDNGGLVLTNVHLELIFWGTTWSTTTAPRAGQIIDAVINILGGPYMSGLRQYRNIRKGTLRGITLVTAAQGSSPARPPNPFSNGDVQTLISNLIAAGRLPSPASDGQLLYCVVMPPNTNFSGGFAGEHTYYGYGGQNAHYAWVTNNGTLGGVTSIFSHELVESVTDPEGSAILGIPGTCSQSGWCEIADVCYFNGVVNGVTVQAYWSNSDNGCVIPDAKYEKDHKDSKDQKDKDKDAKDQKDRKDHKEVKEGAKEKEAAKEKDQDFFDPRVDELSYRVDTIGQRVDELAQGLGESFIQPAERPPVGEHALEEDENSPDEPTPEEEEGSEDKEE
jgi:hypothetical protein